MRNRRDKETFDDSWKHEETGDYEYEGGYAERQTEKKPGSHWFSLVYDEPERFEEPDRYDASEWYEETEDDSYPEPEAYDSGRLEDPQSYADPYGYEPPQSYRKSGGYPYSNGSDNPYGFELIPSYKESEESAYSGGYEDPYRYEPPQSYEPNGSAYPSGYEEPYRSEQPQAYEEPDGHTYSNGYEDSYGYEPPQSYSESDGYTYSDGSDNPYGFELIPSYKDSEESAYSGGYEDPYRYEQPQSYEENGSAFPSSYADPYRSEQPQAYEDVSGYGYSDSYSEPDAYPTSAGYEYSDGYKELDSYLESSGYEFSDSYKEPDAYAESDGYEYSEESNDFEEYEDYPKLFEFEGEAEPEYPSVPEETDEEEASDLTPRLISIAQIVIGAIFITLGIQSMSITGVGIPVTVLCVLFYAVTVWFFPSFGWVEGIGALLLALFQSFGNVEGWDASSVSAGFNGSSLLYLFLTITGGFFFFRAVISFLFHHIALLRIKRPDEKAMKAQPFIAGMTAVGFLLFLPYYLTQYPAVADSESMWQIQQALGNTPLNALPSVFHTLIIRLCLFIGGALSLSQNGSLAVYSLLSMLVMSFVFACVIFTAYKRGLRGIGLALLIVFYYLTPFNGIYAVTVWKDVLFGAALLGMTTILFCIFARRKTLPMLYCAVLFFAGLFLCLLRSSGIYAYLVSIPFLIVAREEFRPKMAAVTIVTTVVYLLFSGPIASGLGAEKADYVESISVPLQQIAYTVTNGGEITEEQRKALEKFMDYDQIKDTYVPYNSENMKDFIRNTGDVQYLEAHKREFRKTWTSIGMKNPVFYLKGLALETRGFWFLPNEYYRKYGSGVALWNEEETGFTADPKLGPGLISGLLEFFDRKVYSLFWSSSLTSWCVIILFLYAIKKKLRFWPVYLPSLFVLASLIIAAPAAQEFRYAYGLFLSLPMMLTMTALIPSERKEEDSPLQPAVSVGLALILPVLILLLNTHPNAALK